MDLFICIALFLVALFSQLQINAINKTLDLEAMAKAALADAFSKVKDKIEKVGKKKK